MLDRDKFLGMAHADAARSLAGYVPHEIASRHPESFLATWLTGGERCGQAGTCVPREVEAEPGIEPLLELLDDLGAKRRLVNALLAHAERGTFRERDDHNGSWSEYGYKALPVAVLHEKLAEAGLVEGPARVPAPR